MDKLLCLQEIINACLNYKNEGLASYISNAEYKDILKKYNFTNITDSLKYYNSLSIGSEPVLRYTKTLDIIFINNKINEVRYDDKKNILSIITDKNTYFFK